MLIVVWINSHSAQSGLNLGCTLDSCCPSLLSSRTSTLRIKSERTSQASSKLPLQLVERKAETSVEIVVNKDRTSDTMRDLIKTQEMRYLFVKINPQL